MKVFVQPVVGEPFEFTLTKELTVVGRSHAADLALQDPSLSRRHCQLHQLGEALTVKDLGSRNGTFVNTRRIDRATLLQPGDEIRVSDSLIRLAGRSRLSPMTHTATVNIIDR